MNWSIYLIERSPFFILTNMVIVEDIKKSYGKQNILNGISFSVGQGEAIAIVGRNGSGKSTLMQILSGIQKPDAGSLQYFNRKPLEDGKAFRELCGYVPQANPLMEELSVKDNLKLFGASPEVVENALLAPLELKGILNKPVYKLSGGMKRRVAIACALHHLPAILMMDEPTTALDIYFKASIYEWMKQYKQMGGILILSTHEEAEIQMCEKRIEIQKQ